MPQPPNTHDPHSVRGPHGLQNLPQVELEIVRGTAQQRTRRVAGPAFLIGRADDNDLVLGDRQFPEAHSYIMLGPQGVTIKYMGSGPELMVNGCEVMSSELRDGDTICTGPYEFLVRVSPPPYRGRSFAELTGEPADGHDADDAETGVEGSSDDGDPIAQVRAVRRQVALLSLRPREPQPVGEITLKLPYWLRPPLPHAPLPHVPVSHVTLCGAACVPPQHFRANARVGAPVLDDHSWAAPKRAI